MHAYTRTHIPGVMCRCRWMADHFSLINAGVPKLLNTVNFFHSVLGPKPLQFISSWLNKVRARE